ncbi:CsbD family protein [Kibdelosporangium persicum]|uniref:CsbD family protein n=1 Tax=Kibdelosporangium persicum TaxID=2698649 RepID=A0ABX2F2S2_9PSEU|nr:CsbD family protein [Kibdelosporangium persicum]NRN65173.1 hypothetical protein [Kibdelosporangium persicum]
MSENTPDKDEQTMAETKEEIGEATGDEQLADEGKAERVTEAVKQAARDARDRLMGR